MVSDHVVYCISEPVQTQKTLFLLEMTHWCCCCRCNCRCFSAPRQWIHFSSSCLLVERPHEEHVRNLSACTRLTAKAFLSVSLWLIDLVIVIATVDISTRFSLDKTSDHSLFQFCIDVDPAFFRGSHNSFLRNSNRVVDWVIQYDNLGFKHLQVYNIKPESKKYIPCIHNRFSPDKTSGHSLFQFCIDVDPAFFRGWHNSFLRNSNRVEDWVIQYDNLGFKHLQVNNIEPVSKKYIPCIHNKAIKGTTTPHFLYSPSWNVERQCGKGIGTLFTTLAPKVLRVLGTKIIPALGLGAMEGLGRKMVGGRKKGRTLGKRTCAMIRPQHLHKLKPYASMLRSKLSAKQIRALNRVRTHKRAAIIPLTKNQKGGFIGAMLASLRIPILMKALGIWFFAYTFFIFITLNALDEETCVWWLGGKKGGSKHTGGKRKWNWAEVNKHQAEVHSLGPRTTPGTLYEVSHTQFFCSLGHYMRSYTHILLPPFWTYYPAVYYWRFIHLPCFLVNLSDKRPSQLPWRFVVVHCTSKEQSRTKEQTAVTRWFGSHWTVECSINMFSDELWHDLWLFSFMILYNLWRLSDGAFVMQLISLSFDGPDAWPRREFYICELDFSDYFCLTSLILLKQ